MLINEEVDRITRELFQVKKRLEELNNYKSAGAIIRAKTNWLHFGEKSSKYFFALERQNQNKCNLTRLRLDDDSIVTMQKEIAAEQVRFYKTLYRSCSRESWGDPE